MDGIIEHYFYTKEHEWVSVEDNVGIVGITDYAQSSLGDITFIELPEVEQEVEQFEEFVSVESVKAASDIYSPMSGKVVEVNEALEEDPSLINQNCYETGWIAKIEITDPEEISNLLTAEEYEQYLQTM